MDEVARWQGHNLPHWTRPNGTYFMTFRTADSLPVDEVRRLREDFETDIRILGRELGRTPTEEEIHPLRTERYRRAEKLLDAGHGACLLRNSHLAEIASDTIRFFDGERYRLHSWCVMPNHIHVLLTVKGERLPSEICASWKKFSARRINEVRGKSGPFWQEESFDHLVRGPNSFCRIVEYIQNNPIKAGLIDWPWVGGDGRLPKGWEP